MPLTQKQADTLVGENTLHHGEALLVVTTSDLQDVATPLLTQKIDLNFLGNTLVVEEAPKRATRTGITVSTDTD